MAADGVLTLSGAAVDSGKRVGVDMFTRTVSDTGEPVSQFSFDGDSSRIRTIDARDLEGAGINGYVIETDGRIFGTDRSDTLGLFDGGKAFGYGGDDRIDAASDSARAYLAGGGGDDSLTGSGVGDTLLGGIGSDTLEGGGGDDLLNGGKGFDTVNLSGEQADYEITFEDGFYVVTDLRSGSPDGVDRLTRVESIQFSDETIDLPPPGPAASATDMLF